jgi:hypothetical protein
MAKPTKRPFSDFLDRQGTFCFEGTFPSVDFPADESKGCTLIISPPIANSIGFGDPDRSLFMFVDWFNIHNRWAKDECGVDFGTVVDGTVSENSNSLVTVKGSFKNALFWVVVPTGDPEDPTLYGTARSQDVCIDPGLMPSLAEGTFHIEFVNPNGRDGADLPDMFEFLLDFDKLALLKRLSVIANGKSATGTNVHTTQIGLLGNKNCDFDGPGVSDCFPSEIVVVAGGKAL